jgi:hypothetical protein
VDERKQHLESRKLGKLAVGDLTNVGGVLEINERSDEGNGMVSDAVERAQNS